jgi:hypothetical protein
MLNLFRPLLGSSGPVSLGFVLSLAKTQAAPPNKPISPIVVFGAIGSTQLATHVRSAPAQRLCKPVTLENRPNRLATLIGLMRRKAADVYTLFVGKVPAQAAAEV